ncbi:hypothetical protein [Streptomyces sp. Tue6028]|uniref:hypothetical protein n=1 Tax=Streptomyces sp. Tue6028 TaxID=2036037 RepID=UPI003D711736
MKTEQNVVAAQATMAGQAWATAFGVLMAEMAGCFPWRDLRLLARDDDAGDADGAEAA